MKNKTIQILAEGKHLIPAGTKVTSYVNGKFEESYTIEHGNFYIQTVDDYHNHLDFSDVKPIYPHKGMKVPKCGIPFADRNGELLDVGTNGFTYRLGEEVYYVGFDFQTEMFEHFRLKRTLPPTIEVCAECHKEVCECNKSEIEKLLEKLNECKENAFKVFEDDKNAPGVIEYVMTLIDAELNTIIEGVK